MLGHVEHVSLQKSHEVKGHLPPLLHPRLFDKDRASRVSLSKLKAEYVPGRMPSGAIRVGNTLLFSYLGRRLLSFLPSLSNILASLPSSPFPVPQSPDCTTAKVDIEPKRYLALPQLFSLCLYPKTLH